MKLGYETNQYGTLVSIHKCDTCGKRFTICPAVPDDRDEEWSNCLASECESYDESRDVDALLGIGINIEAQPVRPLNAK